jgi:N-acyl amino acid synthase of PEP-CTERM/exosortase system
MAAKIQIAHDVRAQEETFKIRHRVYCEEQGWEPTVAEAIESDDLDQHSSLLVLRSDNGDPVGTVRLVPAKTSNDLFVVLPIERFFGTSLGKIFHEQTLPERHKIAEVSRLAVLPEYRQMLDQPAPQPEGKYSGSMRFYAVQLFLGALAAAHQQGMHSLVMLMEPKLFRYLRALGFRHTFAGQAVDHHGLRVPIIAQVANVMQSLPPAMALEFKRIAGE